MNNYFLEVLMSKHILTSHEVRQIFLWFLFIISTLFFLVIIYIISLFRTYTGFIHKIIQENKKGGVLHEFSYSWIRGVRVKPLPPSRKKEKGDGDSPIKKENNNNKEGEK